MPATKTRTTAIPVREVHVHWIDLLPFDFGDRVVWKIELGAAKTYLKGGKKRVLVQVGTREGDGTPDGEIEFEFGLSELTGAWKDISARKKDEDGYGDPAEFGELAIQRVDRYAYQIVADCGEVYDIRGGALKKLIDKIRDMPLSTKMP